MKSINTKSIVIFILLMNVLSCKSQILPLNTLLENTTSNAYLKDIDNELDPYVGTYKADFQDKKITIFITKEIHTLVDLGDQEFYRDVLLIKYIVQNLSGIIIQNTQNMTFHSNQIQHTIVSMRTLPSLNAITFSYGGTNCGVGWGKIILKKINTSQISWEYRPNDIILDSTKCPDGTDINIYLPETKDLIFTKQ
nr:DUF6705 family protein [uncultured Chryseobacterium sp.]